MESDLRTTKLELQDHKAALADEKDKSWTLETKLNELKNKSTLDDPDRVCTLSSLLLMRALCFDTFFDDDVVDGERRGFLDAADPSERPAARAQLTVPSERPAPFAGRSREGRDGQGGRAGERDGEEVEGDQDGA